MPKSFLTLLQTKRFFIISYLVFLIFALIIVLIIPKADLFLLMNRHHNSFFDQFFKVITMLGDGLTLIMIGLCLLFVKYRYSLLILLAYLYSSIIVQLLKRLFNSPRPAKFFDGINPIRTIEGYPTYEWNSFPSGHSVSAFALAVVLVYLLPSRKSYLIILPIALIVAFSRVYLAQHFFLDVVAGSVLGVLLTFQLIWYLENSKWYHSPKLDGKIFGKRR